MKKPHPMLPVLCILTALLFWIPSREPEVLHMGLNAIVLSVDPEARTVTVADPAGEQVFGASCVLTWEGEPVDVTYCDFETHILTVIGLEDLRPGDAITVNAYVSQLEKADSGTVQVHQIQLMTQRKSTA